MQIAVNKAHFPVTVLGPGRRIGIWLQGCTIGCRGCLSRDTWAHGASRRMPVAELLDWCRRVSAGEDLQGVTLSGGEPFEQPEALAALLDALIAWRAADRLALDLLAYSGLPLAQLRRRHAGLLQRLDGVIAEPFVAARPSAHPWMGSANQRLVALSPLGQARYGADAPQPPAEKRMQMVVEGDRLWCVGIPARGDLQRLEAKAGVRGVRFGAVSWRA